MALYRISMSFSVEAIDDHEGSVAAHEVMKEIPNLVQHLRDPDDGAVFSYSVVRAEQ